MITSPSSIRGRVERRLSELEQYLYAIRQPITHWKIQTQWPDSIVQPESTVSLNADATFEQTTDSDALSFPNVIAQTYWASTNITIPSAMAGKAVYALLKTNAEATVYVNGSVRQGLDVNRFRVLISENARIGETFDLDIMVFTTRDRNRKTLVGSLVVMDEAVASYRTDLRTAFGVASGLKSEHTTGLELWKSIESSLNLLDFHSTSGSVDVSAASSKLANLIEELRQRGHYPAPFNLYLCGNSHIDVTWLWTLNETRQKMVRTTATTVQYMDEYPEYHFAQSQAQLYDFLRTDSPALFEKVREKVAAGTWECIGAAWIEPDCNITGGESLVRQLLYGQKFWMEHFGIQSKTMWLPDTFGYASALPQILQKSGVDTFVTQKLTWSETNPFPHGHFDWEGIDGSKIRCIFPQNYVANVYPEEILSLYDRYPSRDVTPDFLFLYGYGDGGGGPTRENVEIGRRLKRFPGFPQCHFSQVETALENLKSSADENVLRYGTSIPVWKGELYLEFHRGTLTSHALVKQNNRTSEILLRDTEIWCSLAEITNQADYPAADIERSWKTVLTNQFHDILPGTSIPEVFPEVHAAYDTAKSDLKTCIEAACSTFVEPSELSFTVFNSLSTRRTEWIETDVKLAPDGQWFVSDTDGKPIPFQVIRTMETGCRIGLEATVDGFSARVFSLQPGAPPTVQSLSASAESLENDFFVLSFNADGTIASLFDKTLNREWMVGAGNQLQTFDDRPNQWEAWDLNDWYKQQPLNLLRFVKSKVVESGPVRAVLRQEYVSPAGSTILQDVTLYRSIPRVDFKTRIDWKEKRVLLKAAFPVAVHRSFATYEIQYGSIERPTSRNTTWESAKFEVSGHRWTDLSESDAGFSLLNDCKYGHDIKDNMMRISLLRAPTHPDARCPTPPFLFEDDPEVFADRHVHHFSYSCYPHRGDWRNDTVLQASSLNTPFLVKSGRTDWNQSVHVSDPAVIVEVLKKAEDGNGYILRVYEAHGGRRDVSIGLPFEFQNIVPVDLMERDCNEAAPEHDERSSITFSLGAYEIRSFRIVL